MSLKRLVAITDGGAGDGETLAFAAALAAQHEGSVEVLPVYPDMAVDMVTLGLTLGSALSQEAIDELARAQLELQRRIEATAARAAADHDVVFGAGDGAPRMAVLERGLRPALALTRILALCDLVVMGQAYAAGAGRDALAQILLDLRAPVLVGRGDPARLDGPAAIAWDGSPQAGRAVRAALPLLAMASEIHILQCVSGLDRSTADPDVDRLNAYLKAHGVGEGVAVLVEGEEGPALVGAARSRRSGLLVAGAYGHSRLRETMFGGATRAFLKDADGPSLVLAH